MAQPKVSRELPECEPCSIGLLANGSNGPWEVQIDQTTLGPDRWFAQIEGPFLSLYFEIPATDIIGKVADFLDRRQTPKKGMSARSSRNSTLVISQDDAVPVVLIADDEFADRYFLLIGPMSRPVVRFCIAGEDLDHLTAALRQAEEELDED